MRRAETIDAAVALADRHSRFLRGLMRRFPEWPAELADQGPNAFLSKGLLPPGGDPLADLRRQRARTAFGTAIADLTGSFDLTDVTAALSLFADHAVDAALAHVFEDRFGSPDSTGFAVIALGKLGSRELNYSSDIDLLYLFDGDRLARRDGEEPGESAQRIGRRLGEALQRMTTDGYVARVDLRLRPDAEGTLIATPIRRAEIYYQSEALTWERAALIKARFVAGDMELAREFLAIADSFVWRRALDYTAVQSIEDMSLRIRDQFEGAENFGPGFDLKRGRGGVREIEFFTQAHQLIYGGRDETLRVADTRGALAALAAAERVRPEDRECLSRTYELLRDLEHRAQMLEDEQTHLVPKRKEEREALAGLSSYRRFADLAAHAKPQVEDARARYDRFLEAAERPAVPRGKDLEKWLAARKVPAKAEFAKLIEGWRGASHRSLRSDAAQRELERALPVLVDAFGALTTPSHALRRFDDFLGRVPAALRVLALLCANPAIARLLARVMGHAPRLAAQFGRNPELLDVLIGAERDPIGSSAELEAELSDLLRRAQNEEEALDTLRRWARENRFRIGVLLVDRRIDPLDAARAYSHVADAVVRTALRRVEMDFVADHGRIAGAAPIILAMGRYGGGALTESSDLDLVFLYEEGEGGESDGAKPHSAAVYFNRLFQRLVSALTVPTAAGPLYEVDTRLRPSGAQGALAVGIEAFETYQREKAWAWEHMALTRARAVAAPDEAGEKLAAAIRAGLSKERDASKLRARVAEMRRDMNAVHPGEGPLDVKYGAGGLIDLEFVVHFLQLSRQTAFDPDLRRAVAMLGEEGLLDAGFAEAHDLMTRFLVLMRLVEEEAAGRNSSVTRAIVADACGAPDWTSLLRAISEARKTVSAAWSKYLGDRQS
ncbi:bifunctional glutamine synthetase adenylyltransferase/deadenyltransferase [Pacificimonas flava]|uniref:Bifunctional glutamine synthetase adenylyltransferase/deadenyltransferase n=2 Tax=Pacificimonas TaxID=1960290 RepID=A0A219B1J7_9SPHN|nr:MULTISPECIES: bifunctional [glutamate--ammonia ligase]-adenylyl-L-tyrosine phosphorylase/[glutamate--ammonia-ligase] adenylyltransferase [Pacificimonas]MBZ6378318.1 bifunctional [glutamate--ammonia ligase]-adenylyl-L-tyrosine phosphorylase/[glutamate--ammonia-ligase] adenylyltransferase [Pacificimonas aurantium]OWV32074.1 bifunctional glutamine synthetase adenylyltransferase/deadenyltransferase [Pacificimonas flava]